MLNCRLRCGVYNDRVDIDEGWRANGEEGTGQLCITQVRRHRLLKLDGVARATAHLLCAACLMPAHDHRPRLSMAASPNTPAGLDHPANQHGAQGKLPTPDASLVDSAAAGELVEALVGPSREASSHMTERTTRSSTRDPFPEQGEQICGEGPPNYSND